MHRWRAYYGAVSACGQQPAECEASSWTANRHTPGCVRPDAAVVLYTAPELLAVTLPALLRARVLVRRRGSRSYRTRRGVVRLLLEAQ